MADKKNILIIFEGSHIAFSPSIAQMHKVLSSEFNISVLAQDPAEFSQNTKLPFYLETYPLNSVKGRYFYKGIFALLLMINSEARLFNRYFKRQYLEYFFRFLRIKKLLATNKYQAIICVDLKNLFLINTLLKKRSYFLSLELCYAEHVLPAIDTALVEAVIIQSQVRFDYLFKDKKINTFIIPNAPVFDAAVVKASRSGLVYTGTAWKPFGFDYCLRYLLQAPQEKLTVLGTLKGDLLKRNEDYQSLLKRQLFIHNEYIKDEEVVDFLSVFEIGFCFYNFDVKWINNFNYQSAPSGKIFKYIAAGVPVICNSIVGFNFVDEFKCGVRIDQFDADTIAAAVKRIRNNYDEYVQGALNAAAHFSFDKAVAPFLTYTQQHIH